VGARCARPRAHRRPGRGVWPGRLWRQRAGGTRPLGLASTASGSAAQAITIPADARSADLSFWLNVTSDETTITTAYDTLVVEVLGADGEVWATLASFSNLDKAAAGAYVRRGPFDLRGFAGQTIVLRFRAATDVSLVTTFRVDDVSVQ
jgi:hypothetical protein